MKRFALLILLLGSQARAIDANINPRYDAISGKEVVINRGMLLVDVSIQTPRLKFFVDGFAEADGAPENQRLWRRTKNTGYLQELYGEYSGDVIFFKIGRQANRWSDSWIVPSLDIWTARRYERLFVDPLPQQLIHSTGAVISIVNPTWSIDLAAMWDVAQDTYPEPYPEKIEITEKENVNPGLRTKFDINGFQGSFVAARAYRQNTIGLGINYAFDKAVPKLEIGTLENDQKDDFIINRQMIFGTAGVDIFWDQWTFTPQVTGVRNEDPYQETSPQAISYISATYSKGKHDFQFQGFSNSVYNSSFWGAIYTFTLKQKWAISALIQNYRGLGLNLPAIVEDQTGGTLYGIRLQFNGSFMGRK